MSAAEEQRVQDAVRRHARTRAFAGAEDVISAVLSDPGVREARDRVEAAETELGMELSARLQPFQHRYDQAVAEGDADGLAGLCWGKHGRWGRICVLPEGTRPRWRNRTGAAPAGAGRSRGWAGSGPRASHWRACRPWDLRGAPPANCGAAGPGRESRGQVVVPGGRAEPSDLVFVADFEGAAPVKSATWRLPGAAGRSAPTV